MTTSSTKCEKGVLTIAHGDPIYIEMAKSLARSIDRFSPGIRKGIVTDSNDEDLKEYFEFVIPLEIKWGMDVRQKLYIDRYTPFKRTLFVDSDCLIMRSLEPAFEAFKGGNCIVPNRTWQISETHPHHGTDFQKLHARTGLNSYPGFNGGLYYLEEGTPSTTIFERGREILDNYETYGLCEFRKGQGCPGDEPVLGIAMAQLGCPPTEVGEVLIASPFGLSGKFHLDTIHGEADFQHFHEHLSPTVVHFGRWFCSEPSVQHSYERECAKLRLLSQFPNMGRHYAALYGGWHACYRLCTEITSNLWESTPRPVRHWLYGIRSRLMRFSHDRIHE